MRRGGPARNGRATSFYAKYLKSPQWEAKRQLWFSKYGRYCRGCRTTTGRIQLHHMTYERLGHENLSDLIALCPTCHRGAEDYHRRFGGKGDRRAATMMFIKNKRKGSLP